MANWICAYPEDADSLAQVECTLVPAEAFQGGVAEPAYPRIRENQAEGSVVVEVYPVRSLTPSLWAAAGTVIQSPSSVI